MNIFHYRLGTCDENVFKSVVESNEYRLPDRFERDDVIVDVGAHVGSFTEACLRRGAGRVIAFEPDIPNFTACRFNLETDILKGSVEVFPLAVCGKGFGFRSFSGHTRIGQGDTNTGGGFIYGKGGELYVKPEYVPLKPVRVPAIGLSDALEGLKNVRMLKLDAEHSEWEILEDHIALRKVQEIVGEYHCFGPHTPKTLAATLFKEGFSCETVPFPDSPLGLFFSKRA